MKNVFRNLSTRPCKIFFGPKISLQAALEKTDVKLELLTDTDMLLMVEKGIRCGVCISINEYVKTNIAYMKDYDENKESLHLKYWNINILHGWEMSQKVLINNFKCV